MQPFADLHQNVGLQRPAAAHFRCRKRQKAKPAADAYETDPALLHDLAAFRRRTQGEPYVATAESRMTRKGQLPLRREYANAVVGQWMCRLQKERRLAQIGPIGESRHLRLAQSVGAKNHGQRVAAQRLRGEHVDLTKSKLVHRLQPWCGSAKSRWGAAKMAVPANVLTAAMTKAAGIPATAAMPADASGPRNDPPGGKSWAPLVSAPTWPGGARRATSPNSTGR